MGATAFAGSALIAQELAPMGRFYAASVRGSRSGGGYCALRACSKSKAARSPCASPPAGRPGRSASFQL